MWQQWVLSFVMATSAIGMVSIIDRKREPVTRGVAIASIIINALCIYLVWSMI